MSVRAIDEEQPLPASSPLVDERPGSLGTAEHAARRVSVRAAAARATTAD